MQYLKKYYKYRLKQLAGSVGTPQDKLLLLLGICAQNKFFVEVKPFINLSPSFRNDYQLWSAMSAGTYGNEYLYMNTVYVDMNKTLLMAAVFCGNIDRIRFLLRFSKINQQSRRGKTALNIACEAGRINIINFLVDNGGILNVRVVKDALGIAIRNNNLPVFTFLMDRGADPNTISCSTSLLTVLMDASYYGRLEMVRSLVEHGANVNDQALNFSQDARSMLSYAVWKFNTSPEPQKEIYRNISRCLNDRGADVNNVDDIGMTALMFAIQFEHSDVVEYLCAHGAIVNGKMQLLPPPPPPYVPPPPLPELPVQPGQAIPEEEDLYA